MTGKTGPKGSSHAILISTMAISGCLLFSSVLLARLDETPISTNLGNDHGFIIKEYYLLVCGLLRKSKAKLRELMLKVENIIPLWRVVFV